MKVRGRRKCSECDTRWSYYDTGSINCPNCGSVQSVGIDDRTHHTDSPVEFDLTPIRNRIDKAPLREIAGDSVDAAGRYVRKRGFVDAGELRILDDTFVAATELRHVGAELSRELRRTEAEELYFLDLLGGADEGERPPAEEVADALESAYSLAIADAVDAYQRDLRTYLDAHPHPQARSVSGRVRDHRKRIEALDGDVDPKDADRLLRATRDLGKYVIEDDESALVTADNWLAGIE